MGYCYCWISYCCWLLFLEPAATESGSKNFRSRPGANVGVNTLFGSDGKDGKVIEFSVTDDAHIMQKITARKRYPLCADAIVVPNLAPGLYVESYSPDAPQGDCGYAG